MFGVLDVIKTVDMFRKCQTCHVSLVLPIVINQFRLWLEEPLYKPSTEHTKYNFFWRITILTNLNVKNMKKIIKNYEKLSNIMKNWKFLTNCHFEEFNVFTNNYFDEFKLFDEFLFLEIAYFDMTSGV